ncbi:MAG: hypothetical protein KKB30_17340 [Proteobacteria bacterium]|nr:hypothetical protein [Pseudomonadota bacterium]
MNDYAPVHPFWRALAGAGFGLTIALTWARFGFRYALLALLLIVIGGIIGVLAISGE